jgi:hypothetical protein
MNYVKSLKWESTKTEIAGVGKYAKVHRRKTRGAIRTDKHIENKHKSSSFSSDFICDLTIVPLPCTKDSGQANRQMGSRAKG